MAPCMELLAVVLSAAALCAGSPLGVSPRLELPPSTSIGVAPRTQWPGDVSLPKPQPAEVRAVLEVVVPTKSTAATARIVCVAGATGCRPSSSTTPTSRDDEAPLVFVGTRDDDGVPGEGGDSSDDGEKPKVFFVDEDSDEDAIRDKKTKKKDKKSGDVPIIISYDGWKGKTVDDIPIDPDSRRRDRPGRYQSTYDMEHVYSGLSAPAHYVRSQPLYKTARSDDASVTYWDVPLGAETTLLMHRLVTTSPVGNAIYPTPSPSYWRPAYDYGGPQWRSQGGNGLYPGGYRSAVNRRTFQPTPTPGFYGGLQPRVYNRTPLPTSSVWCPPRSPGWPTRPVYPTSTTSTTTKAVQAVSDKLDFESEEDKKDEDVKRRSSQNPTVKIIGNVQLTDFRK